MKFIKYLLIKSFLKTRTFLIWIEEKQSENPLKCTTKKYLVIK